MNNTKPAWDAVKTQGAVNSRHDSFIVRASCAQRLDASKVSCRPPGPSRISLIRDRSAQFTLLENNATATHRSLQAMKRLKRAKRSNRHLCMDPTHAQKQPNYSSLTRGTALGASVAKSPSTSIAVPARPTHRSTHYRSPSLRQIRC